VLFKIVTDYFQKDPGVPILSILIYYLLGTHILSRCGNPTSKLSGRNMSIQKSKNGVELLLFSGPTFDTFKAR